MRFGVYSQSGNSKVHAILADFVKFNLLFLALTCRSDIISLIVCPTLIIDFYESGMNDFARGEKDLLLFLASSFESVIKLDDARGGLVFAIIMQLERCIVILSRLVKPSNHLSVDVGSVTFFLSHDNKLICKYVSGLCV